MSVSYELMVSCPIIIRTPLVLLYSNRRVSVGGVSVYPVLQGGESTELSGQEDAGHTALGTGTGKDISRSARVESLLRGRQLLIRTVCSG